MTKRQVAFHRMLALAVAVNEDVDRELARDGLTRSRARVLWELHRRGPTTQRALADLIDVSARNITGLVDALAATGFVTREPHPTDRRATLVTLTAHGAETTEAFDRGQAELSEELFSHMAEDRLDCFIEGLDAVLAKFKELEAAARSEAGERVDRGAA
jgi:DNA-binding MarR family transcriptional regulator